jgi:hypothetical protein
MIDLNTIVDCWNIFFFDPNFSSASLGLFRIVFGLLCFFNFLLQMPRAAEYFGPDGYFGAKDFWSSSFYRNKFSLFRYLPDHNISVYFLLLSMMVISLFVCVGFYSRFSCFLLFLGLISLGHRNSSICSAADAMLRIFSLLLVFSRSGNVLSVDAYLSGSSLINDVGAPWAQRLMMIQVSIIYLYSVLSKVNNTEMWRNGTASFYIMQNRVHTANIIPDGFLTQPFVQIATYGTLLIEFMTSILIWVKELRPYCIVAGLMLHIGLEFCLKLQLFGYVMMVLLLLFLDPLMVTDCFNYLISGY